MPISEDVQINDGSLLEAARELRLEVVNVLLNHHHAPKYSSFNHNSQVRSYLGGALCRSVCKVRFKKAEVDYAGLGQGDTNPRAPDGRKSLILLCLR